MVNALSASESYRRRTSLSATSRSTGSESDGEGGVSDVTVNTGGSIIVEGMIDFTGARADDSLALIAGNAIEVITDAGGISMTKPQAPCGHAGP